MRISRYLLAALSVLFVAGVVLQVFFAGYGLFGAGSMSLHMDFGWLLALIPIPVLVTTWPARAGRGTVLLAAGLVVLAIVQVSLPGLRSAAPLVAALHPVNALLLFGGGLMVARRSVALARSEMPAQDGAALPEASREVSA